MTKNVMTMILKTSNCNRPNLTEAIFKYTLHCSIQYSHGPAGTDAIQMSKTKQSLVPNPF